MQKRRKSSDQKESVEAEKNRLEKIAAQIDLLTQEAVLLEKKFADQVKRVHPDFRKSAKNLLHYLALRRHDMRELQDQLAEMGLSSLGRAESHVLASLQAVRKQLCFLLECRPPGKHPAVSFPESAVLLRKHTQNLLGAAPKLRNSRIMVTFSSELATDYDLICRMMQAGMDCARINCAHDNKTTWLKMIRKIRKAEKALNLSCNILFDLMGPKLRTGTLKPGPQLVVIRPVQNELGKVTAPATVWLSAEKAKPPFPVDAALPVKGEWLATVREGDTIRFHDTRGRKRIFSVVSREENGVLVNLLKTSYICTGTRLTVKSNFNPGQKGQIGYLPPLEIPILLKKDHFLLLTKELKPGEPARFDAKGHLVEPAHISCTLPEVFDWIKGGQPILFNDGKIEGKITEITEEGALVIITAANETGSKLRADQGINLPESILGISGLTEKDKRDLAFVVKHADIVNLSFVNRPETVEEFQEELQKYHTENLAVMLKIETQEGFRNLPLLLLAVMRFKAAGIMIARGDLAVECGWQRLAEVQEEILWLCEAAHLPVVWATQVLETLAKKGRPSRAEITDAAMAQRADCVMLNKGNYIIPAIAMLDDILKRMQQHQHKKTAMLRVLKISELE
jgi:pyruvate kinase